MATPPAGGVHRLTDILTEEVSLVDRAANGKPKFLVIKQEGAMPQPLSTNPDGTLSTGSAAPAPAAAAASTPPASAAPAPATPAPQAKAGAKLTADMQTALGTVLADLAAWVTQAQDMVAGAEVVPELAMVDAGELPGMLLDIAGASEDSAEALVEDAMSEPPEGEGEVPVAARDLTEKLEVKKAARVLMLDQLRKTAGSAAAKVWRRMGKKRLARFQQALEIFAGLHAELQPVVDAMKAAPGPALPTPPAHAPPAGPPKKDDEKDKPPVVPAAKGDGPDAAALQSDLAAAQSRLAAVTKQLRDAAARVQPSAAMQPQGAAPAAPAPKTKWEQDMAPARPNRVTWNSVT